MRRASASRRAASELRGRGQERVIQCADGSSRRTSAEALRLAGLCESDLVSCELDSAALDAAEAQAAWNRALRLLAYRERSRAEISTRLAEDGYPLAVTEGVIARCADEGYVDDSRFAEAFVRAKLAAGWGRRRIVHGLEASGITPEMAMCAVNGLVNEADEIVRARAVVSRIDTTTRAGAGRAMRKLLHRGYAYDAALTAIRSDPDDIDEGASELPPCDRTASQA